MPFQPDGASADSTFAGIGYALPAAHLIVEPDKLLALVRGFEAERERVRQWISDNAHHLRTLPAPGVDPCSTCTVDELGRNGESAVAAAHGYARQLGQVAESLGEIARAYGLMDDGNASKYKPYEAPR